MVSMEGVSFGYRRRSPRLFEGLGLQLEPGNVYGLLGRNGAGKTTLLRLVAGLLFPKEGSVSIDAVRAGERSPATLRELFFVPEEFHTPALNAKQLAALYGPLYPRFDADAMARWLDEFQSDPEQKMSDMSYGQKKKVLLAFAVATRCRLLILDEPTNALDIPAKSQFRRLLAGATEPERIIVVSTHQVRDLEHLIDPIVVLEEGQIVFQHSVEEISRSLSIAPASDGGEAIYTEGAGTPGARSLVSGGEAAADSAVDIELLFNAIVQDAASVEEAFSRAR